MSDGTKPMGFMTAMKDFFGFKTMPDGSTQNLSAFSAEVKALNDAEKAFFREGLIANGYVLSN